MNGMLEYTLWLCEKLGSVFAVFVAQLCIVVLCVSYSTFYRLIFPDFIHKQKKRLCNGTSCLASKSYYATIIMYSGDLSALHLKQPLITPNKMTVVVRIRFWPVPVLSTYRFCYHYFFHNVSTVLQICCCQLIIISIIGLAKLMLCTTDCPSAEWRAWNGNCYIDTGQSLSYSEAVMHCGHQYHSHILTVYLQHLEV